MKYQTVTLSISFVHTDIYDIQLLFYTTFFLHFWEDCFGAFLLKENMWLLGNIRLQRKSNNPRGPMRCLAITLLIQVFICFDLLCMGTSCHSLGCPCDTASGLKHKFKAPQWRYTAAATWGLLSHNPRYNLSTWIWSQNIQLYHLLWSQRGAYTSQAMTPLRMTGCAVSVAPWADWQHHALGKTNKTIGLLRRRHPRSR